MRCVRDRRLEQKPRVELDVGFRRRVNQILQRSSVYTLALASPDLTMQFSVQGMDDPYQDFLATGGGSGQGFMGYVITPSEAHLLESQNRRQHNPLSSERYLHVQF